MTIQEITVMLGEAIQKDERFIKVNSAKEACDADAVLQDQLKAFTESRDAFLAERQKENADEQKCKVLNLAMREMYDQLMANGKMQIYQAAQGELSALVKQINDTINFYVTGEQPCTHNCSTCGGCS